MKMFANHYPDTPHGPRHDIGATGLKKPSRNVGATGL